VIQAGNVKSPESASLAEIRDAMIEKHLAMIADAAAKGVQILCLQELFYGPYFAAEQDPKWYEFTERVPDGPTVKLMQEQAKKHGMAMVMPVYEEEATGIYYNTAAGAGRGRQLPRQVPQEPHPALPAGLLGEVLLQAGEPRLSRVQDALRDDRRLHLLRPPLPEGGRALGLHGAEIVFIPSATTSGHSDNLWNIEQTSMAIANGFFVGTNNRVGREQPWNIGEFYGSSYFCDPTGRSCRRAAATRTSWSSADLDLDMIQKVRAHWQFYRDRRPRRTATSRRTCCRSAASAPERSTAGRLGLAPPAESSQLSDLVITRGGNAGVSGRQSRSSGAPPAPWAQGRKAASARSRVGAG
jgi:N-carbamoylputrescine amidase